MTSRRGWMGEQLIPTMLFCLNVTCSRPEEQTMVSTAIQPWMPLLHQEQATVDPGARQQIFRQIHRYLVTKFPFIVLYGVLTSLAMVRKGTHNYQQNPLTQNFYNS